MEKKIANAKRVVKQRSTKQVNGFVAFIREQGVVGLAIGFIIGAAAATLVKSLVDNVITPLISGVFKAPDFSQMFVALDGKEYESLDALNKAGAPAIKYGVFINDFVNLMIVAFSLFIMVHYVLNAIKKKEEAAPPPPPPKQEVLLEEIRDLLRDSRDPAKLTKAV